MPLARRLHVHRASPSVSCLYASKAEFDNLSGIPSREIRKILYGLCAWSITKFPDICIVDGYPIYLTAFGKPQAGAETTRILWNQHKLPNLG